MFYHDLVITNIFSKGSQMVQGTYSGGCVHTDVKWPQFSNVYQTYCYLFLSWILKSIQFPVDYWFKMWLQAPAHVGSAPLLSHTIADRQKGHLGLKQFKEERAGTVFFLTVPFPLEYVPQLTNSWPSQTEAKKVPLQGLPQLQPNTYPILAWFKTKLNFPAFLLLL